MFKKKRTLIMLPKLRYRSVNLARKGLKYRNNWPGQRSFHDDHEIASATRNNLSSKDYGFTTLFEHDASKCHSTIDRFCFKRAPQFYNDSYTKPHDTHLVETNDHNGFRDSSISSLNSIHQWTIKINEIDEKTR